MSSSQQLYNRVSTKLQALHPTMHLKRLTVWVWVVVGLIQGQSVQLSEIANHIPSETQAVGRIARVRRWLASKWIVSRTLYQPLDDYPRWLLYPPEGVADSAPLALPLLSGAATGVGGGHQQGQCRTGRV
jgi:hypothetical protein